MRYPWLCQTVRCKRIRKRQSPPPPYSLPYLKESYKFSSSVCVWSVRKVGVVDDKLSALKVLTNDHCGLAVAKTDHGSSDNSGGRVRDDQMTSGATDVGYIIVRLEQTPRCERLTFTNPDTRTPHISASFGTHACMLRHERQERGM